MAPNGDSIVRYGNQKFSPLYIADRSVGNFKNIFLHIRKILTNDAQRKTNHFLFIVQFSLISFVSFECYKSHFYSKYVAASII